jgi:dynactin 1
LAGSRQSLAGSRSQLASPATDRPPSSIPVAAGTENLMKKSSNNAMSPPETIGVAKRASFIETGFLETLKPQFTAGQSLISPSPAAGVEEKINAMQQQQEIEELRGQVRDLSEKLETLRQRRAEDKERYREFDKMKMQYEQLQEFKTKIMDAQTQLQRDLQRAKQDAKDAIEARDLHIEEMSELAENAELITLDKEMAEEKSDTLQLELDQAKERIEELTLDLEILKTEMQERCGSTIVGGSGADGEGITTYEFKQLEQQNTRLRETLVRMRDLSAHEKHENQKLLKELETKKSEVAELQRTKEKLSAKIDELEAQVVDLQEQVDAALGAEEMVEQLAEKKMELEDRCKLLEEEVAELEALEEVHEQLVESNHELELDLREELDMAHAAKREAAREKDAAFETIIDRDQTILKFRELVQKLNDQAQELREKMNQEFNKSSISNSGGNKDTNLAETIDFKQMFAESKAYTRAIDLQLRQIELAQSNEHVRYLMAYMPDTFMARGGDHDAIQVILLVSRIVFKAGIVVSQARERFPAVTQIDRNTILQGHTIHQFSFRSRLLHHIHNLQSTMHQFLYGLSACTPETLLKIGASIPEMVAQEKTIDFVVELLKVNQMDEHSSTESNYFFFRNFFSFVTHRLSFFPGLEKTVTFFNAMYSLLLANDNLLNETQIVRDCIFAIGAACDSIGTDAAIIQSLIKVNMKHFDFGFELFAIHSLLVLDK